MKKEGQQPDISKTKKENSPNIRLFFDIDENKTYILKSKLKQIITSKLRLELEISKTFGRLKRWKLQCPEKQKSTKVRGWWCGFYWKFIDFSDPLSETATLWIF